MFEKFTERARRAVVLSLEEARRMEHDYIGTEHLLLGLLREEKGVAARALSPFNVTLDRVREQIQNIVGYGDEGTGGGSRLGWASIFGKRKSGNTFTFTRRSKRVLESARGEALQLGHDYIGTEHLLLGLLRQSDSIAVRVLSNLEVDPDEVRQEAVRMLGGSRTSLHRDGENLLWPVAYRTRVTSLEVNALCGSPDAEKAKRQKLFVSLEVGYTDYGPDSPGQAERLTEEEQRVASSTGELGINLEDILEGVVETLEQEWFGTLEEVVNRAGRYVLDRLPVPDVTVSVVRPARDTGRKVPEICVEGTFTR